MTSAIDRRLLALEAAGSSSMVCSTCRDAGGVSTCAHFGVLLALVPRIEFASTTEWLGVRASGLRALEATSATSRGKP